MKKLLLYIAILGFTFFANAQKSEINWMSLEEAVAAQEKEPRKIMIDMYTSWCGPCKLLDRNTFKNTDVATYVNKNYYAVKFNAEGNTELTFKGIKYSNPGFDASRRGRNSQHQLASYLGVNAYPTILFLDENSNLLLPIKGYHNPNQLEIFLKIFATDTYKTVTTKEQWAEYQKNFKPQFKG